MQRIFRRYPVVPVYGDMHITLLQVLQRAPHFKMDKMGEELDSFRKKKPKNPFGDD